MDRPQNIFGIYDIIYNIFEYAEFNPAYMLYNRAFSKLVKTRQVTLYLAKYKDADHLKKFEQYKQLFVDMLYPSGFEVFESVCSYENVMGIGIRPFDCLGESIFTQKIYNIKKLCLFIKVYSNLVLTQLFPQLEELSITYNPTIFLGFDIRLCDHTDMKYFFGNNIVCYTKKFSISGCDDVVCFPSKIVEYLSICTPRIRFGEHFNQSIVRRCDGTPAPFEARYKRIKHMKLMTNEIYNFHACREFPNLETLTIDINLIDHKHGLIDKWWSRPIDIQNFRSLKKIAVCATQHPVTDDSISCRLEKILGDDYSIDLILSKTKNFGEDLREFCKVNNIRITHE